MSDKSAPQTPSRAAGSREDPILGVKVKDFLCAEMIVTSGLLRNVRAGSLLCADGALAWSAAPFEALDCETRQACEESMD